jgi:hypothetical protein
MRMLVPSVISGSIQTWPESRSTICRTVARPMPLPLDCEPFS